jgi:hypothetical protein
MELYGRSMWRAGNHVRLGAAESRGRFYRLEDLCLIVFDALDDTRWVLPALIDCYWGVWWRMAHRFWPQQFGRPDISSPVDLDS